MACLLFGWVVIFWLICCFLILLAVSFHFTHGLIFAILARLNWWQNCTAPISSLMIKKFYDFREIMAEGKHDCWWTGGSGSFLPILGDQGSIPLQLWMCIPAGRCDTHRYSSRHALGNVVCLQLVTSQGTGRKKALIIVAAREFGAWLSGSV